MLLRSPDLTRSRRFYRDTLGLAVYREFGDPADPAMVFFTGGGFLEVTGGGVPSDNRDLMLWLQVRDVASEHARLADQGVPIVRPLALEPWGLIEMWLTDPDGVRIVLVQIPAEHPLRRDTR